MKKKQSSIGCLFWIALALLVIVVFLFNRKTIETVLKNTGFLEIIKKEKPAEPEKPDVTRSGEQTPETKQEKPEPKKETPIKEEPKTEEQKPKEPEKPVQEVKPQPPKKEAEVKPKPEAEPEKKVRNSKLYFVTVDDKGEIGLTSVVRPVTYTDSPLAETIKALTAGLTPSELNRGYLSLLPDKAVLHSAAVRDGIAFLDFSEQFTFNSFGVEGYKAQLKQVIYTATEFSGVKLVQITIEGKKRQYLAPEGVFIGAPLSRESF